MIHFYFGKSVLPTTNSLLIASMEASAKVKSVADFVLDGEADQGEVREALEIANGEPVFITGTIRITRNAGILRDGTLVRLDGQDLQAEVKRRLDRK